MSAIPKDYENIFIDLEMQAGTFLRKGHYDLAENIYNLLLTKIYAIQDESNIRIHKGAHYYNIGLADILQNKLQEALKNDILAYIEDVFTARTNYENDADIKPAAKVLKNGFNFEIINFEIIKNLARNNKENISFIKKPIILYNNFLSIKQISDSEIISLCSPRPTLDNVRNSLFTPITKEANEALSIIIKSTSEKILTLAARIAKEKGHPNTINEEDIKDAIKLFEEKKI
jgi:histone H3/H4